MKSIRYTISLKSPLTKDQREHLVARVQWLLKGMEIKLREGINKMDNPLIRFLSSGATPAAMKMIKARIEVLLDNKNGKPFFYSYYCLESPDDLTYVFSCPDKDEMLAVKSIAKYLPSRDVTMDKFLIKTLTEMGLKTEEFKISFESSEVME